VHSSILEILEVPQLMEKCVKSEFYEDSLLLQQYTKQLAKKHSQIPVIQSVVSFGNKIEIIETIRFSDFDWRFYFSGK
jgi:hypothetical protein